MTVLVDTSVWSLLLRRDTRPDVPEVTVLVDALKHGDRIATTGAIVQELLQGGVPPRVRDDIVERFSVLPYLGPTFDDHVTAAGLSNLLRSSGIRVGATDALIAQLAIEHDLVLLTTDRDFEHIARVVPLRLWTGLTTGAATSRPARGGRAPLHPQGRRARRGR